MHRKGLAAFAGTVATGVLIGCIVKGIPLATIGYFLWSPFVKVWAALAVGYSWLVAPASTTHLAFILLAVAALGSASALGYYLNRARSAAKRRTVRGGRLEDFGLRVEDKELFAFLSGLDGADVTVMEIQDALGFGNLQIRAVLHKLDALGLTRLLPGQYVRLTDRGIQLASQNGLLRSGRRTG